jgi:hypothetical protein
METEYSLSCPYKSATGSYYLKILKLNSVALVRERTTPTERPPHVGEVSSTFADRGRRVVSATNSQGRKSRFSKPEPLFFFQAAPQLSSRGWVDPVPDPLLLRKSGSARNRRIPLSTSRNQSTPSRRIYQGWPNLFNIGAPYEHFQTFESRRETFTEWHTCLGTRFPCSRVFIFHPFVKEGYTYLFREPH